jgi:hypothetical protein
MGGWSGGPGHQPVMRVFREADAPRVDCRRHGVKVTAVPWARHGTGHTYAFDQQAAWMASERSRSAPRWGSRASVVGFMLRAIPGLGLTAQSRTALTLGVGRQAQSDRRHQPVREPGSTAYTAPAVNPDTQREQEDERQQAAQRRSTYRSREDQQAHRAHHGCGGSPGGFRGFGLRSMG